MKRTVKLTVRLTPEEREAVKRKAQIAGLKQEPFVRKLILDCKIRPRPPDSYLELSRQIAAVGNNLNQIARLANSSGQVQAGQTQEALAILRQIWQLVREEL